jgi:MraZ protein
LEKAEVPDQPTKFFLTMGMEDCLFLFTPDRWNELTQAVNTLSLGTSETRDFERLFFSDTREVEVDGSGRILIPDVLKTSAKLKREVVLIGAGRRVEIWDVDIWKNRKSTIASGYAKIAAEFFK